MQNVVAFFFGRNVLINVVFIALMLFAVFWAIPKMAVDRYPNIEFGEVEVTTMYPGASPEEVEVAVTQPLEDALRDMENLEFVRGLSRAGQSSISVKFIDDTDYRKLYDELRLRILGVQNGLPTVNGDPLQPSFNYIDVDEWLPLVSVNLLTAEGAAPLSVRDLTLLGKELRTRLESVEGVKNTVTLGDSPQQFDVVIDPDRLRSFGVTLQQVIGAIQASGQSLPAGTIQTGFGERIVRIDSRYRSPDDIANVVVRTDGDGQHVRVRDLIQPGASGINPMSGQVLISTNGKDCLILKVLKEDTANVLQVRERIEDVVDEFLGIHGANGVTALFSEDNTVAIKDGMGVLVSSLMLSVILVIVLLFVFMANRSPAWNAIVVGLGTAAVIAMINIDDFWIKTLIIATLTFIVLVTCRAAVLTVSGIAFSFLGALLMFWLLGYSINEITLMGFVLVSGIIVDDAIVVLENIQRHREEGKPIVQAAVDGTSEVALPVISATITTVCSFLPMLMMTGSVGDFFSLVPISVSVALAISLVEALIILPLHAVEIETVLGPDKSLKSDKVRKQGELPDDGLMAIVSRIYDPVLRWTLKHWALTIFAVFLLFAGSVAILIQSAIGPTYGQKPILSLKFFPDDATRLLVRVESPPGTSVEQTDQTVRAMGSYLEAKGPGIVANAIGIAGLSIDLAYKPVFGAQKGMITIEVPAREDREFTDEGAYMNDLRSDLEQEFEKNGLNIELSQMQGGPPSGAAVNVRITGIDESVINRLSDDLLAWMETESDIENQGRLVGVIDLHDDRNQFNTVWDFSPDSSRTALYGLDDLAVQSFVAAAVEGSFVGDYRRSDGDIPVKVRLPDEVVADSARLTAVPLANDPSGRILRFEDLGELTSHVESAALSRRDFQRTVTITGNLSSDAKIGAANVVDVVRSWYRDNAHLYPGASIAFGGEAESTGKSYQSLLVAFVLSVVLIYAVLAGQFRSYFQPLLIMSNIVFSFTGVVLAMAAFAMAAVYLGENVVRPERAWFTVNSFIAIVGLTGLVINDAIVLIDFINKRRIEGMPLERALIIAGHQRMRPICLTSLTTVAGLLPMAIGIPHFSITWGPFATSFIAGLTLSTFMTLLVVPVLYKLLALVLASITGKDPNAPLVPDKFSQIIQDNRQETT